MKINYNGYEIEVILLTLSGSRLYGNATDSSDWDYRGIFIAPPETKIGLLGKIEQITEPKFFQQLNEKFNLGLQDYSDCIIYELNRFAQLASDSNPNIFDTLCIDYTNTKYTVYVDERGKELIDNRSLFMSSRLKFTFSGYAISQLAKIKNRDKYLVKYPDVSRVLSFIKEQYGKTIDWNWTCDNFGGVVAEFVSGETAQNHTNLSITCSWTDFASWSGIETIDKYRIPRLIDYCNMKNIK